MEKKLKDNNKRFINEEGKREWIGDVLHGADFVLNTRNKDLERVKRFIHELQKMEIDLPKRS